MNSNYCSILTQSLKVDPAGTAPENISLFLFYELKKPWVNKEKNTPGYPTIERKVKLEHLKVHLFAPHPIYSKKGFRRIIYYIKDKENDGLFHKSEYVIPIDKSQDLVKALTSDNQLDLFIDYKDESYNDTRDLFICGHYNRDYCCGTFGDELYLSLNNQIKNNNEFNQNIRIWQTSHLKGHKFAPTMINFPEGRFWAHLTSDIVLNSILKQDELSSLSQLKQYVRGIPTTSRFGHIAERELYMEFGSKWNEIKKKIIVTINPDNKLNASVKINFIESSNNLEQTRLFDVSYIDEVTTVDSEFCGSPNNFKKFEIEEIFR